MMSSQADKRQKDLILSISITPNSVTVSRIQELTGVLPLAQIPYDCGAVKSLEIHHLRQPRRGLV